jgi:hypothetical protein
LESGNIGARIPTQQNLASTNGTYSGANDKSKVHRRLFAIRVQSADFSAFVARRRAMAGCRATLDKFYGAVPECMPMIALTKTPLDTE